LLLIGNFMVVLDFTIVNVALPSIERDLGVGTSSVQWVVTGYGIAFSGLLILAGRVGDLLGRRRMFIAGLLVFTLASLAGGLSGSLPLLVAARVVQGAGAAIIPPTALALITTSVPEGPARTRAIGLYSALSAVGFVSGQVLGGVLVEWTSWRLIFLVNVPIGLIGALVAPRLLKRDARAASAGEPAAAAGAAPEPGAEVALPDGGVVVPSPAGRALDDQAPDDHAPGGTAPGGTAPGGTAPGGTAPGGAVPGGAVPGGTAPASPAAGGTARARRPRGRRLDVPGAVLVTAAVALVVFGVSQGDALGWSSPLVIGALVLALAVGAAFLAAEARHPEPLVRPRLLTRPGLRDGAALAFLLGLWNGGELLLLSLYLQQALHLSPLETGAVLTPQGIAGFSIGVFGPRLAGRLGVRRMAMVAGLLATVGFLVLTRLPGGGYSPLLTVVMLVGWGSAGTAFGSLVIATRSMRDADQGVAGGVVNTSRQIGAAVGAALLPAVAESVAGGIPGITGDRIAMAAAAAAALAATAVAWNAARQARVPEPQPAS
jgi:MFS family permease